MLKTEPVAAASGAAGALPIVVGYLVAQAFPALPAAVVGAVTLLVVAPIVAGVAWVARSRAFSENTIREAGLDPAVVEQKAQNPAVKRCTVGEQDPPSTHPQGPSV
jgi:hypothetical protein